MQNAMQILKMYYSFWLAKQLADCLWCFLYLSRCYKLIKSSMPWFSRQENWKEPINQNVTFMHLWVASKNVNIWMCTLIKTWKMPCSLHYCQLISRNREFNSCNVVNVHYAVIATLYSNSMEKVHTVVGNVRKQNLDLPTGQLS